MGKIDIGDIGEKEFATVCTKAGFSSTVTNKDKHGWDYLVECPTESVFKSPSLNSKSFVQVKSSLVGETRWEITLQNAWSLASSSNASFIALMSYETDLNLKEILLLHFDKKILKRIYQRLNKELEKDHFVEMHKKSISFELKDGKKLSPPIF